MSLLIAETVIEGRLFQGLDPAGAEFNDGTVYLLHLLVPYRAVTGKRVKEFTHYIGRAHPGRLVTRMKQHGTSEGARCLFVAQDAGIDWLLVRTWPGAYEQERRLKNTKNAVRYCPACILVPRDTSPGGRS